MESEYAKWHRILFQVKDQDITLYLKLRSVTLASLTENWKNVGNSNRREELENYKS